MQLSSGILRATRCYLPSSQEPSRRLRRGSSFSSSRWTALQLSWFSWSRSSFSQQHLGLWLPRSLLLLRTWLFIRFSCCVRRTSGSLVLVAGQHLIACSFPGYSHPDILPRAALAIRRITRRIVAACHLTYNVAQLFGVCSLRSDFSRKRNGFDGRYRRE